MKKSVKKQNDCLKLLIPKQQQQRTDTERKICALTCLIAKMLKSTSGKHSSILSTYNVDRLCSCRNRERCPLDGKCLETLTRLMSSRIKTVISMVLVMENVNLGKIITQIYFAITIIKKSRDSQNLSNTYRQMYQLHPKMEYHSLCLDKQM